MLLFLSLLGIFLSVIMLIFNGRKFSSSIYLSLFFLMTLEAIGMLSGFSSRNTFLADFKKFEGESPGSYASRFN